MPKPKRQGDAKPHRTTRFAQPDSHTAKPHRKGPRPASPAPAPYVARDVDEDVHVKKRWANEPPGVRAMRESVRDAAIKAAGHPVRPKRGVPVEPVADFPAKPPRRPAHADTDGMPPYVKAPKRDVKAPRREGAPTIDTAAPKPPRREKTPALAMAAPRPPKPEPEAVAPVAAAPEPVEAVPEGPGFDELGLNAEMLAAVAKAGYETPTPIQAASIPVLISGRDLIGEAQTGTGKTAAFALPAVQLVDPSNWATQVLVLAPTRELAIQVAAEIQRFAAATGARVTAVYGGQPIDRQFRALRNGAQIVVGTPGRVLDHMRRETLSLAAVKLCVLDEGDEMLALGFQEEVEAVLAGLMPGHQTALFSATMSGRVPVLARKYLNDPVPVKIETRRRTVDTTKQTYYDVAPGKKLDALARVLDMETPGPTIVFCRTRQETEDLADALRLRGYVAESLNGDMGQTERERVLHRFREGQADLLIATDVAARGLDIETVTHVINFDIPWDVEQYIHRIGRTGRAGRTGDAITLVEPRQRRQLGFIEQAIGVKMTPARVPTASDIAARRRRRFIEALSEGLEAGEYEAYLQIVAELSDTHDPSEVAAAALKMLWKSWAASSEEIDAAQPSHEERAEEGMVRVFLTVGRQGGLRPGDLVGMLTRELGLTGRDIGAIDIQDKSATVEVPGGMTDAVIDVLTRLRFHGRKVNAGIAGERPR